MAMGAGDHETGLTADAEQVLTEIPRDGTCTWWIPEHVLDELLKAELVQMWWDDETRMIGPL